MNIASELADAKGVAMYAAGELQILLDVYEGDLPASVADSLVKLQASLATVAKA